MIPLTRHDRWLLVLMTLRTFYGTRGGWRN